jgi:hypothetical protein
LDLYLAYLRAAFHTCYYCAIVTDHLEELQRKCIKHVRKPLTSRMLEEIRARETDGAAKAEEPTKDGAVEEEKPAEKPAPKKDEAGRDWKRNGEHNLR